ncbi:lipid-A-disaccharide synthase [Ancylothrix sp. C2]|uniref:lipid-A-disaccharide synthase n=1 Tax=Ancylothrix sp. D3o TaxID=2953691 RepID=UPI0021BA6CB7|nr:lipid-A-disaccharide synthase [Ancylothrix sp. D3o]MCT7948928.1 lipid-A-disaccharide synthase [Ancylothrix sp. D3o]
MQPIDILILSNGPGEITTWVRPVVKQLRQKLGQNSSEIRISVVLSPCPHATGKEAEIARSYPEINRVQEPQYFTQFLLWGKTAENWDWRQKGVVIFLGGDQIFPVIIGKRLNYRTVVYAEWDARWYSQINYFAAMQPQIIEKAPKQYASKFTVVGDLMAESSNFSLRETDKSAIELIGLLPGSKPAKLAQGVPLSLSIAEEIYQAKPKTKFVIPVAPTLELNTLAKFADPNQNPLINKLKWGSAKLIKEPTPKLITSSGLEIELYTKSPAYDLLAKCSLCLTTVGANTAELGSLGVPMIVLLPTQQLDAMRAWDGLPGILANLPGIGAGFAKLINAIVLREKRLFAWPNIWAKQEIIPELVGNLEPATVAQIALDYLNHPEKLTTMRERLRQVRGKPGAAEKLAEIVYQEIQNG